VSGMHIQAPQIHDIHARAKATGKVVVLGGPSASASPEFYPDIEYLHLGELGDATDHMIETIDRSVAPPAAQSSRRRFGLEQRRNGRGGEVFGHFEVVSRPQAAFRRPLQPGAAHASSSPNSGAPVAREADLGNRHGVDSALNSGETDEAGEFSVISKSFPGRRQRSDGERRQAGRDEAGERSGLGTGEGAGEGHWGLRLHLRFEAVPPTP